MSQRTRTNRIDSVASLVIAAASLWPAVSLAQSFPAEGLWVPLHCSGQAVMTDLLRDQAGAQNERDIVGEITNPAGLRAFDQSFLYLRLRLDADAAPGGKLRPFAWGYELDTDGKNDTYEILLLVRGNDELIALHRNTAITEVNSPSDPADEPPIATYPFSPHGRSIVASGSSFGGNADYFLDIAVPWSDLATAGFGPTTTTVIDSDGDGYSDQEEIAAGTNPHDPNSFPQTGHPDEPFVAGGAGCALAEQPEIAAAVGAIDLTAVRGWSGYYLYRNTPRRSSVVEIGAPPFLMETARNW